MDEVRQIVAEDLPGRARFAIPYVTDIFWSLAWPVSSPAAGSVWTTTSASSGRLASGVSAPSPPISCAAASEGRL